MRKSLTKAAAACGVFLLIAVACVALGAYGVGQVLDALPTSSPKPSLQIGQAYWVNALLPPAGLPAGLVSTSAEVFNKPGTPLTDPSITITAAVPNGTRLTLAGLQGNWCYVEGTSRPLRDYGTFEYEEHVQGWLRCDRLLDYEPTPYPTPNRTAQPPLSAQLTVYPSDFAPLSLASLRLSQYDLLLQYSPHQWAVGTDQYGFSTLTNLFLPGCQIRDGGIAEVLGESKGSYSIGELSFDVFERLADDGRVVREYLAVGGPGLPHSAGKPFIIVTLPPNGSNTCLNGAHDVLSTLRTIN